MPASAPCPRKLLIVPGSVCATFIVCIDSAISVMSVRSARFLEGLLAAGDMLSFGELLRDDAPLDELLPWAGNV